MTGLESGRSSTPQARWRNWARSAPLVLVLASAGCAKSILLPRPITAESTAKLSFSGVRTYASAKGVLVTGRVYRPRLLIGPLWGHIHIVATFADGRPVSVDTRWSGSLSKGSHSAWFAATIPTTSPDRLTAITVSYRPKRD